MRHGAVFVQRVSYVGGSIWGQWSQISTRDELRGIKQPRLLLGPVPGIQCLAQVRNQQCTVRLVVPVPRAKYDRAGNEAEQQPCYQCTLRGSHCSSAAALGFCPLSREKESTLQMETHKIVGEVRNMPILMRGIFFMQPFTFFVNYMMVRNMCSWTTQKNVYNQKNLPTAMGWSRSYRYKGTRFFFSRRPPCNSRGFDNLCPLVAKIRL